MSDRYVIGQTASGISIYSCFASLDSIDNFNPNNLGWFTSHIDPEVTYFSAGDRREVLALFAMYPKLFYRCEIVRVDRLDYATGLTRPEAAPNPEPRDSREHTIDDRTRCRLVTQFSRATRTDLLELKLFHEFLADRAASEAGTDRGEITSETYALLKAEIERRNLRTRNVLESIWLEPLGNITIETKKS